MIVAIVLTAGVVLQLALPGATALPEDSGLAPRRLRMPTPTPTPDYPAVLRAPIFSPDRTPGEQSATGPAQAAISLQLVGVAMSGRAASAVVKTPDGVANALHAGETLQGWRLVAVASDRAIFLGPGGRTVLLLGGPAATAKPATAPNQPTASETQ